MKKLIPAILSIFTFLVPLQLQAGGVILYEIASADTRLASAGWSARAQDPSTLFTNPAGMTRLHCKQVELGSQAIYAHAQFKPNSSTDVRGSDGVANIWLPSGSLFYVHPCNDRLTLGIGNLGYFGSDLVYAHHWVGRYYVQKVLLEGISLVPAAAFKINSHWSVGAGANIMYGFFKQRAAVRNFLDGGGDGYFNVKDYKYGFGGIFGILYEPTCHTRFGIQYMTPVRLNFRAKPNFHNLGPELETLLDNLGIIGSSLDLHINVPQSVMLSAYHEINPCWSIMGNVGWQQWSNFQKVTVNLADPTSPSITSKVKYQDTWHVAVGGEWHFRKNLTFSGGVAYDSSAISNKERTLEFPVGQQWRFGTGARWKISEKLIVDLSSELQWQGSLKCDQDKPTGGHVNGHFRNCYALFLCSNLTYVF